MMRIESQTPPSATRRAQIVAIVRRMFRLDEDFSAFYAMAAQDPQLAWVTSGAGRLLASPTVFEDIVKTVCTTNCAWSGTQRMVGALVLQLGEGAFPTAIAMASARESFYRDVARAGYRGAYLRELARRVANGDFDPETLLPAYGMHDDACEELLLALPGVGRYACAHIMLTIA